MSTQAVGSSALVAGPDRTSVVRERATRLARDLLMIAAVIGLWQWLADGPLAGKYLLASPTGAMSALCDDPSLYLNALGTTASEAAWGFLWGNAAALVLAAVIAVVPAIERIVLRVALVIFCLPLVALGPLLRILFGSGTGPQVTLAALAVYYTTLVPLTVGLRAVPSAWLELVASYGRGRTIALLVVRLPACVPYLAAGLQIAVPAALLGALVGEFTGADSGLGVLTIQTMRSLNINQLWALAAASAAASVVGYVAVGWIGARLSTGHPPLLMSIGVSSPRAGRAANVARTVVEVAVTAVIVLAGWAAIIRVLDLNPFVAKSPSDVASFLFSSPDAAANRHIIFSAFGSTAETVVPGYLGGLLLGVALAATFHLSRPVRRAATPVAVALRCVPIVAVAPLLVTALGRGFVGTVVVVALMTFFPTLVACSQGLRRAPGQVLDFFATFSARPTRVLAYAELPAMAPAFFAAARIAIPSSILAATVAEWLATGKGIGNLMAVSAVQNDYATVWSAVAVLTVIAVACYGLVSIVEALVLSRLAPEQVAR